MNKYYDDLKKFIARCEASDNMRQYLKLDTVKKGGGTKNGRSDIQ